MADLSPVDILYLQNGERRAIRAGRIAVLGEVLWDMFEDSCRLGGAPLNFAAHARRLGHDALLLSALGSDPMGDEAGKRMAALDLDLRFLQRSAASATGKACVEVGPDERTRFVIPRPAAYDCFELSSEDLRGIQDWAPGWVYFGTLFAHFPQGHSVLRRLLGALPACSKIYDLNLRRGHFTEALVEELLGAATVVKLNEEELEIVHSFTGLPGNPENFCRQGARRYGWKAVCVTLGARGCAVLSGEEYAEARGLSIHVADPVGAGDAFAAAFVHGLISGWAVAEIAEFANRVGALVASRRGAVPEWTVKEAVDL